MEWWQTASLWLGWGFLMFCAGLNLGKAGLLQSLVRPQGSNVQVPTGLDPAMMSKMMSQMGGGRQ